MCQLSALTTLVGAANEMYGHIIVDRKLHSIDSRLRQIPNKERGHGNHYVKRQSSQDDPPCVNTSIS